MQGKWIEMFRAGRQTDSAGNTREWTEQDLDKIVEQYNGGDHEAPIVVGHPDSNSPAFGWVEKLKREGKLLYAKLKDVMPEFEELVKAGTYKKRSISLYPDLTLRHIGFLGGMPPAVKGLANIFSKSGEGAITYEFADWRMSTLGRIVMRMRDYLVEKEGAEKADGIISSWDVQDMLTPPPEDTSDSCYNEPHKEGEMKPEEVQKLITDAVTAVSQQFGETIKGLQTTITEMNKGIVAGREEGQRREFREFLMQPEMQRRVAEGSREATINHMMTLVGAAPVEFGEGDAKTSKPALDAYKEQLKALPEVVQFGEFATGDRAGKRDTGKETSADYGEAEVDQDRLKIHNDAIAYQEAHAGTTYDAALAAVMKGGK